MRSACSLIHFWSPSRLFEERIRPFPHFFVKCKFNLQSAHSRNQISLGSGANAHSRVKLYVFVSWSCWNKYNLSSAWKLAFSLSDVISPEKRKLILVIIGTTKRWREKATRCSETRGPQALSQTMENTSNEKLVFTNIYNKEIYLAQMEKILSLARPWPMCMGVRLVKWFLWFL